MNKANTPGAQKASGRKRSVKKAAKQAEVPQEAQPTKADFKRENNRKIGNGVKYVLVAIGVLAMLLSVTGVACSGVLNQVSNNEGYKLTGGVAATVNDVKITEDTVTEQIMSTRSSMGYDSDEDWANYLASNNMTPESYREQVINNIADQLLVSQAERDNNISVSDDEVEDAWKDAASSYGSEDDFVNMLSQVGYTEDSYKEMLRQNLMTKKLYEAVAPVDDPSDKDIIAYANENLDTYNGAKRSSHILIKVDSGADDAAKKKAKKKAQEILDKINAGDISFKDAAKKYSEDSSASKGGDVGWDKLTTFVDAYQKALDGLKKGEVSGVVESDYGYHIIKCTDVFKVDGKVTSIDQIPKDLRSTFSQSIKSTKQGTAYNDWLTKTREEADIKINDMPADVPYNVDMSKAGTSSDDADSSTGSDAGTSGSAGSGSSDNAGSDDASSAGDSK